MECWIEPYTPSRFARQFGYDQLYVGNPNSELTVQGTLLEGARAWFYSVAGGTGFTFSLPSLQPKLLCSLNFGCWFLAARGVKVPPSFLTNLGESSTGALAGAASAGAGGSDRKDSADTSSDRAISASSLQTGASRGRYRPRKTVVSKRRRPPSPLTPPLQRSSRRQGGTSTPSIHSSPSEVIEVEEDEAGGSTVEEEEAEASVP